MFKCKVLLNFISFYIFSYVGVSSEEVPNGYQSDHAASSSLNDSLHELLDSLEQEMKNSPHWNQNLTLFRLGNYTPAVYRKPNLTLFRTGSFKAFADKPIKHHFLNLDSHEKNSAEGKSKEDGNFSYSYNHGLIDEFSGANSNLLNNAKGTSEKLLLPTSIWPPKMPERHAKEKTKFVYVENPSENDETDGATTFKHLGNSKDQYTFSYDDLIAKQPSTVSSILSHSQDDNLNKRNTGANINNTNTSEINTSAETLPYSEIWKDPHFYNIDRNNNSYSIHDSNHENIIRDTIYRNGMEQRLRNKTSVFEGTNKQLSKKKTRLGKTIVQNTNQLKNILYDPLKSNLVRDSDFSSPQEMHFIPRYSDDGNQIKEGGSSKQISKNGFTGREYEYSQDTPLIDGKVSDDLDLSEVKFIRKPTRDYSNGKLFLQENSNGKKMLPVGTDPYLIQENSHNNLFTDNIFRNGKEENLRREAHEMNTVSSNIESIHGVPLGDNSIRAVNFTSIHGITVPGNSVNGNTDELDNNSVTNLLKVNRESLKNKHIGEKYSQDLQGQDLSDNGSKTQYIETAVDNFPNGTYVLQRNNGNELLPAVSDNSYWIQGTRHGNLVGEDIIGSGKDQRVKRNEIFTKKAHNHQRINPTDKIETLTTNLEHNLHEPLYNDSKRKINFESVQRTSIPGNNVENYGHKNYFMKHKLIKNLRGAEALDTLNGYSNKYLEKNVYYHPNGTFFRERNINAKESLPIAADNTFLIQENHYGNSIRNNILGLGKEQRATKKVLVKLPRDTKKQQSDNLNNERTTVSEKSNQFGNPLYKPLENDSTKQNFLVLPEISNKHDIGNSVNSNNISITSPSKTNNGKSKNVHINFTTENKSIQDLHGPEVSDILNGSTTRYFKTIVESYPNGKIVLQRNDNDKNVLPAVANNSYLIHENRNDNQTRDNSFGKGTAQNVREEVNMLKDTNKQQLGDPTDGRRMDIRNLNHLNNTVGEPLKKHLIRERKISSIQETNTPRNSERQKFIKNLRGAEPLDTLNGYTNKYFEKVLYYYPNGTLFNERNINAKETLPIAADNSHLIQKNRYGNVFRNNILGLGKEQSATKKVVVKLPKENNRQQADSLKNESTTVSVKSNQFGNPLYKPLENDSTKQNFLVLPEVSNKHDIGNSVNSNNISIINPSKTNNENNKNVHINFVTKNKSIQNLHGPEVSDTLNGSTTRYFKNIVESYPNGKIILQRNDNDKNVLPAVTKNSYLIHENRNDNQTGDKSFRKGTPQNVREEVNMLKDTNKQQLGNPTDGRRMDIRNLNHLNNTVGEPLKKHLIRERKNSSIQETNTPRNSVVESVVDINKTFVSDVPKISSKRGKNENKKDIIGNKFGRDINGPEGPDTLNKSKTRYLEKLTDNYPNGTIYLQSDESKKLLIPVVADNSYLIQPNSNDNTSLGKGNSESERKEKIMPKNTNKQHMHGNVSERLTVPKNESYLEALINEPLKNNLSNYNNNSSSVFGNSVGKDTVKGGNSSLVSLPETKSEKKKTNLSRENAYPMNKYSQDLHDAEFLGDLNGSKISYLEKPLHNGTFSLQEHIIKQIMSPEVLHTDQENKRNLEMLTSKAVNTTLPLREYENDGNNHLPNTNLIQTVTNDLNKPEGSKTLKRTNDKENKMKNNIFGKNPRKRYEEYREVKTFYSPSAEIIGKPLNKMDRNVSILIDKSKNPKDSLNVPKVKHKTKETTTVYKQKHNKTLNPILLHEEKLIGNVPGDRGNNNPPTTKKGLSDREMKTIPTELLSQNYKLRHLIINNEKESHKIKVINNSYEAKPNQISKNSENLPNPENGTVNKSSEPSMIILKDKITNGEPTKTNLTVRNHDKDSLINKDFLNKKELHKIKAINNSYEAKPNESFVFSPLKESKKMLEGIKQYNITPFKELYNDRNLINSPKLKINEDNIVGNSISSNDLNNKSKLSTKHDGNNQKKQYNDNLKYPNKNISNLKTKSSNIPVLLTSTINPVIESMVSKLATNNILEEASIVSDQFPKKTAINRLPQHSNENSPHVSVTDRNGKMKTVLTEVTKTPLDPNLQVSKNSENLTNPEKGTVNKSSEPSIIISKHKNTNGEPTKTNLTVRNHDKDLFINTDLPGDNVKINSSFSYSKTENSTSNETPQRASNVCVSANIKDNNIQTKPLEKAREKENSTVKKKLKNTAVLRMKFPDTYTKSSSTYNSNENSGSASAEPDSVRATKEEPKEVLNTSNTMLVGGTPSTVTHLKGQDPSVKPSQNKVKELDRKGKQDKHFISNFNNVTIQINLSNTDDKGGMKGIEEKVSNLQANTKLTKDFPKKEIIVEKYVGHLDPVNLAYEIKINPILHYRKQKEIKKGNVPSRNEPPFSKILLDTNDKYINTPNLPFNRNFYNHLKKTSSSPLPTLNIRRHIANPFYNHYIQKNFNDPFNKYHENNNNNKKNEDENEPFFNNYHENNINIKNNDDENEPFFNNYHENNNNNKNNDNENEPFFNNYHENIINNKNNDDENEPFFKNYHKKHNIDYDDDYNEPYSKENSEMNPNSNNNNDDSDTQTQNEISKTNNHQDKTENNVNPFFHPNETIPNQNDPENIYYTIDKVNTFTNNDDFNNDYYPETVNRLYTDESTTPMNKEDEDVYKYILHPYINDESYHKNKNFYDNSGHNYNNHFHRYLRSRTNDDTNRLRYNSNINYFKRFTDGIGSDNDYKYENNLFRHHLTNPNQFKESSFSDINSPNSDDDKRRHQMNQVVPNHFNKPSYGYNFQYYYPRSQDIGGNANHDYVPRPIDKHYYDGPDTIGNNYYTKNLGEKYTNIYDRPRNTDVLWKSGPKKPETFVSNFRGTRPNYITHTPNYPTTNYPVFRKRSYLYPYHRLGYYFFPNKNLYTDDRE